MIVATIVPTGAIHIREKERDLGSRIARALYTHLHAYVVPLYSLIKVQLVSISYFGLDRPLLT